MTVAPLQSLPLGFRFRPTDEELVNHYLKRKINGRIRSEIEVIPEIDVCKCEPWDLPDKALIRSEDPEWFFFAPKDRKYPNGHRSNRATEAGYWKATGKDRTIRTKAPAAPAVIGMKKTLVFHRGRAPKGIRTRWIMHEYRATEPEFESGEQGGYVLYRLFRKPEDTAPSCNDDEMEGTSLSPTPTKSSPCDPQNEADASEELLTPIMAEPLNKLSAAAYTQEDPQSLLTPTENQPAGITIWLADEADRSSIKPEDLHCNSLVAVEKEVEAGAVVDPLWDALGNFYGQNDDHINSNDFSNMFTPKLPYNNHPFLGEPHMGLNRADYTEDDPMNMILNSILSSKDDFSGGSSVQQISAHEVVHSRSSSEVDTEAGLVQGGLSSIDPAWFLMDTLSDFTDINSILNENTTIGPDVYSVDSGSESLQELFNSLNESNSNMNAIGNNVGVDETKPTGVIIRPRPPQPLVVDNISSQQGDAGRRIRLQLCNETEDDEDGEAIVKVEDIKEQDAIVDVKEILESAPSIKLEASSIHDVSITSNIEESKLSHISEEFESKLRWRAKSTKESITSEKLKDRAPVTKSSASAIAMAYAICLLVCLMTILAFVCFGIRRWRSPGAVEFYGSSV